MYDFELTDADMDGVEVLLATYNYENYEGYAFVFFRKGDKYYEVHGSHCSCYGLEGQWEPEEANLEELRRRMTKTKAFHYRNELLTVLDGIDGAVIS